MNDHGCGIKGNAGLIMDSAGSVIMVLDSHKRIEYMNRQGLELFGFSREEVLDQPVKAVLIPAQNIKGESVDAGKYFCVCGNDTYKEHEHVCKDGSRRWICWCCQEMHGAGAEGKIVCVGIDITGHHFLHEEMRQQQLLAVKADRLRSLGEMASGMAHEFNQPLTIIRGAAENLFIGEQRGWDITSEERMERLQVVIDQTSRLTELIDHVRSLSNKSGSDEVVAVDCAELIMSALGLVTSQIYSRGIEIDSNIMPMTLRVVGNPFALEEAVLAILYNARDAVQESMTENGDKEKKIYVYCYEDLAKRQVVLEIKDSGVGISEGIADRIFEPFFTNKDPGRGTGLGLSSAKNTVESIGGSIEVESEIGKGTLIRLVLPASGGE